MQRWSLKDPYNKTQPCPANLYSILVIKLYIYELDEKCKSLPPAAISDFGAVYKKT